MRGPDHFFFSFHLFHHGRTDTKIKDIAHGERNKEKKLKKWRNLCSPYPRSGLLPQIDWPRKRLWPSGQSYLCGEKKGEQEKWQGESRYAARLWRSDSGGSSVRLSLFSSFRIQTGHSPPQSGSIDAGLGIRKEKKALSFFIFFSVSRLGALIQKI